MWILAAITVDSWRCSQCGSKEVSPIKSREGAIPKWLLILVLVCIILLSLAVCLWPNGTEEEKKVSLPYQVTKQEQAPKTVEFKEKKTTKESKQVTDEPKISIKDYDIEIYRVRVDELSFNKITVLLKNEGNILSEINRLILSCGKSKIDSTRPLLPPLLPVLTPGEEKWYSIPTDFYPSLQKKISADEIKATISVIGSSAQAVAKKDITIPIPIVRIGETIPQVGVYQENKGISLTLLSCKETDIGVNGSYNNGYHTVTPKSDMKFIIVSYRFRNNASRPRTIPSFRVGEIATKKGYIYEDMTNLIRNSGGHEKLLSEESIKGCVVFEIPKSEIPVEANIYGVPALIKFEPSK